MDAHLAIACLASISVLFGVVGKLERLDWDRILVEFGLNLFCVMIFCFEFRNYCKILRALSVF
jgi:hypothetical protein